MSTKTVFVLGAGASKEASLPTGTELTKTIATLLDIRFDFNKLLSGDPLLAQALLRAIQNDFPDETTINSCLPAALRIRDAMPQALSIDNFLDAHRGDYSTELCGKLAIARAILNAERLSNLYIDNTAREQSIKFSSISGTWFNRFFQLVTENCRSDDLPDRLRNIGLIIFNYDRCFEHFFLHALQNYYGIPRDSAATLVNELEIHHPYGSVGKLPWQDPNHYFSFGSEPSASELVTVKDSLRTFAEGMDADSSNIKDIQRMVQSASTTVYLGFAYHSMNLSLLSDTTEPPNRTNNSRVFGTALGISNSDCDVVRNDLRAVTNTSSKRIFLHNDKTCNELLGEHWRRLSFRE